MNFLEVLLEYTRSSRFKSALGLPDDAELSLTPLGQGEYNINYSFFHFVTGQRLVLRVNTGSQMHLDDQIGYEYAALRTLIPSGRTPHPLYCDGTRDLLPYGVLVMEWLPGRPLCYQTDLPAAAAILADIHSLPVAADCPLLTPTAPLRSIYEECLSMAEQYFSWEGAQPETAALLHTLIREIGTLPLSSPAPFRCITNTELNSGNFLINEGKTSYLVDWEKPLLSEPAQDLGHFLVPTTTYWKTDTILSPQEIAEFVRLYTAAVAGRRDCTFLRERLPLFFTVTCLRGVTWCAMALREYSTPGRPLTNDYTLNKIKTYLQPDFLRNILENYIRRDFLRGCGL